MTISLKRASGKKDWVSLNLECIYSVLAFCIFCDNLNANCILFSLGQ